MNKLILSFYFTVFFVAQTVVGFSQNKERGENRDTKLTEKLNNIVADFNGEVGIYVKHLKTGKTVHIAADTIFPTASMIKVPILLGVFKAIEEGKLSYRQELIYRDSLLYPGEDILGSFKDSTSIHLDKVLMLMLTMSDNTASLWLQHLAGTGSAINKFMNDLGFVHTRVNSRTPGREPFQQKYGWGQTTPKEMAEMLVFIREGKIIGKDASEIMYRNLTRTYWNEEAISQIPPFVQAASKQGAVNQSKSEVVLVNAPSGDYVFSVITKNQEDERWEHDNEGYELIRKVSKAIWDHYEGK